MSTEKKAHHLHLTAPDVGRYALLPANPGQVETIAGYLDDPQFVASNREFTTWRGSLHGQRVVVTSTGVGGPSSALAVEELADIGVDTAVRIGVSGTMQPDVANGTVAILTGAIRDEGTSRQYLPLEYPALADPAVVTALTDVARSLGVTYRCGLAHTKDSFYGETDPDRMPMAQQLKDRLALWTRVGALCSEMETASVLVVASVRGWRAGSVVQMWSDEAIAAKQPPNPDALFRVAVDGLARIVEADLSATASTR